MSKVFVLWLFVTCITAELLENGDFEFEEDFLKNWYCNGKTCNLTSSKQFHSGNGSVKITDRSQKWHGLATDVNVTPETLLIFKGFIKILNKVSTMLYHTVKVLVKYKNPADGKQTTSHLAISPYLYRNRGWTELGFDWSVPKNVSKIKIFLQIEEPEVNYLFDDASLTVLTPVNNWRELANQRIESIRKANITITVKNESGVVLNNGDIANYSIDLAQTKSEFPFGTAVGAAEIMNDNLTAYHDVVYSKFAWATIENAFKWRQMERQTQGEIDYERGMPALERLLNNSMTVRGHNLIWGKPDNLPLWVTELNATETQKAIDTRIEGTLEKTKGKFAHWDVYNENLHGDLFEQKTRKPLIIKQIYKKARKGDPNAKLFLNEFSIINRRMYTTAYKEQARFLLSKKTPIDGVGMQSHFKSANDVFIPSVKYRLDKVAEAKSPLWITELSIAETNVTSKAEAVDRALTLYFSHPAVHGIVLWGFWDGKIADSTTALFEGPNVVPNAAGKKLIELMHTTFRTNLMKTLHTQTVRGFKGDYTMTIQKDGKTVETKTFTLGKSGVGLDVKINNSGSTTTQVS